MSNKVQIVKRLEVIKSGIELEDEEIIALQLQKLKAEDSPDLKIIVDLILQKDYSKINQAIDDYIFGFKNANLTPHQQEIFDAINEDIDTILKGYSSDEIKKEDNHFVVLSGFAGVGKTFVTSKLIKNFLDKEYKILLTTPTHKSLNVAKYMLNSENIRVYSKTLQSYLNLKLKTDYRKGTKMFARDKTATDDDYEKNLDILIVDESSMVSNELLYFIEENLHKNKLKSVLFIGDQYQLPPIDEGTNGVIELSKQHQLTHVVRQAQDSYIKLIAISLKQCIEFQKYEPIREIFNTTKYPQLKIFHEQKEFLEDFYAEEKWYEKKKILASFTNDEVDEYNRVIRFKYWQEQGIVPDGAVIKGDFLVFNESYVKKFQNSEVVQVTKSEKLFDNYAKIYYWQCEEDLGRSFKVVDPQDEIAYNKYVSDISEKAKKTEDEAERKKAWRHYFATKESYADMKYIYASTIHKLQGSTYEQVYISVSSILNLIKRDPDLAYRLLYVAVTRASKQIKILI